jgi:hypothetical protein
MTPSSEDGETRSINVLMLMRIGQRYTYCKAQGERTIVARIYGAV